MTTNEVQKILKEIDQTNSTICESFYELGLAWAILKKEKAHRVMEYDTWEDFVHSETNYSRSYVDFCIRIAQVFGRQLEHDTPIGVNFDRLKQALPYVRECEKESNAQFYYEQAKSLKPIEWNNTIRIARGRTPTDICNCIDTQKELYAKCLECEKYRRVKP